MPKPKVAPVRRNMLARTDDGGGLASGNETRPVAWSALRTDGGTQMRVGMSQATIDEYTEAMRNGSKFPPLVVFLDEDGSFWLADGFHRYQAMRQAFGANHVADCIVMPGGKRQAILYAAQANAKHGLPRTPEDKRQAVDTLLADADWAKWSDNEIAERCAVSQPFVSKRRKQLTYNVISEPDPKASSNERTYTTKHGTTATMQTGKIGKGPLAQPAANEGGAPRPLTLDETMAVIWRLVKQTGAGDQRPEALHGIITNNTKMTDYRHLLTAEVTFSFETFSRAWTTVVNELSGRIEHAKHTAQEARPRGTRVVELPTTITLTFALLGEEAERKAQFEWFKGLEQTTLAAYMQALYQTNGEEV